LRPVHITLSLLGGEKKGKIAVMKTAIVIAVVILSLGSLQNTQGVSPTPDGDYATQNTAEGSRALESLTTGFANTASGYGALTSNTTGSNNTANGNGALFRNTTGNNNTADGLQALFSNTTGNYNTALGRDAGTNVSTADHVTCIGATVAGANVSRTTWIGNVYGVTTITGGNLPVVVSPYGQLGTTASARRFKKDIETMDRASEAILAFKPVRFHYKNDTKAVPQFGLVAEDVAKVNPDLVVNGPDGKPYTVRYDAVNAMLLNEFLKEHRTVQEQGATIAELKKQIQALTAGLQKVSAQFELSKAAPQVVNKP
jgi:trimeric autotransporter adhesin